jgi:transmembrane sensor
MDMNALQSPEDLLADESFLGWYYKTDPAASRQWEEMLKNDSSHKALVDNAIEFLRKLEIRELPVPAAQLDAAEARLFEHIAAPIETGKIIHTRWGSWRMWVSAAACILVVATAGLLDRYWIRSKTTTNTPYGQIGKSVLPDGTEVTLNAHSTFTYRRRWIPGEDREVWLKGEAFFHVKKTALKDRFIVHTDHFDVIVTGTSFNVVNQPDQAGVILKEGRVTLLDEQGQELKMVPGDDVVLKGTQLVKQNNASADDATLWMENKVNFDNTAISDVIKLIDTHYGVKVEVSDPKLLNQTVTGVFPNDNLDALLKALELTRDYKVERTDDKVILSPAK